MSRSSEHVIPNVHVIVTPLISQQSLLDTLCMLVWYGLPVNNGNAGGKISLPSRAVVRMTLACYTSDVYSWYSV